jgi:hypothetical protein
MKTFHNYLPNSFLSPTHLHRYENEKLTFAIFIIEFNQIIKKFNSSWFELRPDLIQIDLNWVELTLYISILPNSIPFKFQ